ncbi:MAG: hydrogenase expression/formation protein HypE [Thermodesulfobacteriota bacterium]
MQDQRINLDHGSGGKASHKLVADLFRRVFDNPALRPLEDCALLDNPGGRLAFSTDSYVVDPIFFPGGDIGELAVNGTVNDLAMRGARPLYLSVGMILEEGLAMADLERIALSMKRAADAAGVALVTGDTKVVPAGKADRIFINTAGIGVVEGDWRLSGANARVGDAILMSGSMADHGVTILCRQQGLNITGGFRSDTAPLYAMVAELLRAVGHDLRCLRDPTRGGVATTVNEIAAASGVGMEILEDRLVVRADVRGACELLGLDPLYLANEGKLLAFVENSRAEEALAAIRRSPFGGEAAIIGRVVAEHPGRVYLKTKLGSKRLLDMLAGHPLPRIC